MTPAGYHSPRTRIALVGAGRMGQVHLAALKSSDQIAVAAVVEPVAATCERLRAEGLVVYESVTELLDSTAVDGVLIAAPTDQHPELVATFAAAGIPMLCEKPVGVSPDDAERATRAAADAGVLLQVGYWRRFVPELRRLRERIAAGELGQISLLSCMQWDAGLPSEQFRSHSGGLMVDMGVHEFDQTRWLLGEEFGPMVALPAGPSTQPRPATDPDSAVLLASTSGGTAVTISLGRQFPHPDSCWVEVWGTRGYARIPFMWGAEGEDVFRVSMRRQAEAFARAVGGAACEGAQAPDAIAAQLVAARAAEALGTGIADVSPTPTA
ncbi:MAG: Gfo/Idh/MocA family oxidoreductase [Acidobacteriota bacterium]|nr:Gfo/Idh/MocA family oxidoreductase [Acidobacteriota bacterium]